jgi:KRAB domain-containing zinc finger protein
VCSQSFRMKSTLIAHQVSHTGECPFVCDACYRSFKWRNNLVRHISSCCVQRL